MPDTTFRSSSRTTATLAFLATLPLWVMPLPAQDVREVDLIFSLSGGISYGAYQAGANYGILHFARQGNAGALDGVGLADTRFRVPLVTGASAGNINAFLTALTWCAPEIPGPTDNLFWKIWIPTGAEQLLPRVELDWHGGLPRPDSTYDGILSRAYFNRHYRLIKDEMRARTVTSADCPDAMPIGISLTRQAPDEVHIGELPVPVQRFVTAFVLRKPGAPGSAPGETGLHITRAETTVTADSAFGRIIELPHRAGSDVIGPDTITLAIAASSAFPTAFAPVLLPYLDPRKTDPGVADSAWFLDGGLFDNNPLALALGLREHTWVPGADTVHAGSAHVAYIDPGSRRHLRETHDDLPDGGPPSLPYVGLDELAYLVSAAVTPARKYELHALARQLAGDPRAEWIHVTGRHHPVFGSTIGAFGAFLGRPLREFDFYVGLYDGLYYATLHWLCHDDHADEGCMARSMSELLRRYRSREWVDPGGWEVMSLVYLAEFGRALPDAEPARTGDGGARSTPLDDRSAILAAVAQASLALEEDFLNRHGRAVRVHGDPDPTPLPGAGDETGPGERRHGLLEALARIGRYGEDALDRVWEESKEICARDRFMTHFEDGCLVDGTFLSLVRDPDATMNDLTERALWRAHLVAEAKVACRVSGEGDEGSRVCAVAAHSHMDPAMEERVADLALAAREFSRDPRGGSLNWTRVPRRLWPLRLLPTELVSTGSDKAWDLSAAWKPGLRTIWRGFKMGLMGRAGLGHFESEAESHPLIQGPALHQLLGVSLELGRGAYQLEGGYTVRSRVGSLDDELGAWWWGAGLGDLRIGAEHSELETRFRIAFNDAVGTTYWLFRLLN